MSNGGIDGRKVYKYRKEKLHISQEKLSEISGVSRSQIQRIEMSNNYPCNLRAIGKLADALKVKVTDLIYQGEKLNE